mgnify:CR=1 FL=1
MTEDNAALNPRAIAVENVDLQTKCWVVRPGVRYRFINNFIEQGIIATGHLDGYDLDGITEENPATEETLNDVLPAYPDINSRNIATQVVSFLVDMKPGDIVFTLSSEYVIPGVIKSHPFVAQEIFTEAEKFYVRRTVEWGAPIRRRAIPLAISKSFNAYQAVFTLGDSSKEILHWLMSFFISGENYYSSLRVEQPESINHHSLKQLTEFIDRLQVFALMVSDGEEYDYNLEEIKQRMLILSDEGLLKLTTQQMLMSPGDFWLNFVTNSHEAGVAFLLCMSIAFGSPVAFADAHSEATRIALTPLIERHIGVLDEGINIASVKERLQLTTARQNRRFVQAKPTQPVPRHDEFPEDGEPEHAGA